MHIALGEAIEYDFGEEKPLSLARIIFDSDLNRESMPRFGGKQFYHNMMANKPYGMPDFYVPKTMVKAFRLEGRQDGEWKTIFETENAYQRLAKVEIEGYYSAVRLVPLSTWGAQDAHIFSFDVQ